MSEKAEQFPLRFKSFEIKCPICGENADARLYEDDDTIYAICYLCDYTFEEQAQKGDEG